MTQSDAAHAEPHVPGWKPYPEYRRSGVEWSAEIPAHWDEMRLKFAAPASTAKLHGKPDALPYIGLEHVESGTGRYAADDSVEVINSVVNVFRQSDVLFGKLRPYLAKAVHADCDGVCTTELLVLKPADAADGRFLFYQLLSEGFVETVNSQTYGAKMPRASPEQVANIVISLPPRPEQRAIAHFLDRETAKIDALIAKKEQLIELLQEKRTALITHAVTKGLDPDAPMRDSGVEWLGEIPAHWEVKRLKYAVRFSGGGTPPKAVAEYWDGHLPWVSPKDMKSETITETEDYITEDGLRESATRLISPGAVLLVVRSGILRHSIPVAVNARPVTLNQDMKALEPKEGLAGQYLKFLVAGHQRALLVEWRKQGATVESIEHELLANSMIPIPPLAEQDAIVSLLDGETAEIDALIRKVQSAVERLKEYRNALISAAVTGKIDVREAI